MSQSFAQSKYGVMIEDSAFRWTVPPIYDKIITPERDIVVSPEFMVAIKDGNTGVIDAHNKILIPFEYKDHGWFRNDTIELENREGKWGVLGSGKVIIPFEYDAISYFSEKNGPCIVGKKNEMKSTLYGCIDKYSLKPIIPTIYNEVSMGQNIILAAKEEGINNYAIFDYSGKQLTPFEYTAWSRSYTVSPDRFIILAEKRVKSEYSDILLDMNGKPLTEVYENVEYLNSRLFPRESSYNIFHVTKDRKEGILDSLGQIVIPCQYDQLEISYFSNKYFRVSNNGKCGVADISNHIIIPLVYDSLVFFDSDDLAVKQDNAWSLIDFEGKKVFENTYEGIREIDKEHISVKKNGKWGLIDRSGSFIIQPIYDKIDFPFFFAENEPLKVTKDGKIGFVDKTGKTLVPTLYDEVFYSDNYSHFYLAKSEDKWGVLDLSHKQILPFEYEEIVPNWDNSVLILTKDNKYALADSSGNLLTDFDYQYIREVSYGHYSVYVRDGDTGREGVINQKGEIVVPLKYVTWPISYDGKLYIIARERSKKD